ncbi:MAG: GTP-binding protein [Patescibacteria group bacterium]
MRTNSIPILLLTGFLGSGKTTLLNHLLSNKQGLKVGVIVNDFGEINIDAMLVSAQTDEQLDLSNGCICCSVDEGELDDAISKLAHRGSTLDYIIIEASGLAEPAELATMLRLMKNEYAHFDTLVSVVDAENFEKNNKAHGKAVGDLQISDIVIINKIDLIDEQKLDEIRAGIAMVNDKARIIESEQGKVDFRLLLDLPEKVSATQLELGDAHHHDHHDHDHQHLHDKFESISFNPTEPLNPKIFEDWAGSLDTNIFRAKGIIYFGMKGAEQKFIFQSVGTRYQLKLDEWHYGETPGTHIVVIGLDLEKDGVQKQLDQLVDKNPTDINQDTLMDIFKYR